MVVRVIITSGPNDIVVATVQLTQVEAQATPSVLAYVLNDLIVSGSGELYGGTVTQHSLSTSINITGATLPQASLVPFDDQLEVTAGTGVLTMTFNENIQASTGAITIVDDSLIGNNEVVGPRTVCRFPADVRSFRPTRAFNSFQTPTF